MVCLSHHCTHVRRETHEARGRRRRRCSFRDGARSPHQMCQQVLLPPLPCHPLLPWLRVQRQLPPLRPAAPSTAYRGTAQSQWCLPPVEMLVKVLVAFSFVPWCSWPSAFPFPFPFHSLSRSPLRNNVVPQQRPARVVRRRPPADARTRSPAPTRGQCGPSWCRCRQGLHTVALNRCWQSTARAWRDGLDRAETATSRHSTPMEAPEQTARTRCRSRPSIVPRPSRPSRRPLWHL